MFSSTMTESEITSPSSTTPSSTEFSAVGTKKGDKTSYRKSSKPLMERKRRARINNCLSQLKSLVLQAMKKDNSQYSKLEKADILELTVKHLKHVQRIQVPNTTQIPEALNKYRAGFNECANEVMRYLGEAHGVNNDARSRILSHLSTILTPVNTLPVQQTNHPHILPAPAPAPPQQHQLQPQHQPQQQLQQSHQLLHHQQQQELLQRTFQNELLQQANQQHISGFHAQQPQLSSIITDLNNNNTSGSISNSINRNHINPNANKGKEMNLQSLSSSNNSHVISRGVMQQEMKQTIQDSNLAFQALNVTSCTTTPSIHLPCIATPAAAMATAPFQLVHSTLPNGQVALVLAPQTVSAMNVYTHNPASLISHEIAVSVLDNQQQQMKHHQEQSLKPPPPSSTQEELQRQPKVISPVPPRIVYHDAPISLVNKPASPIEKKTDIESMIHADSRLHQPSAFRLPSSLPSSSSSTSSSPPQNTNSFSSSASQIIIPPSVIKVAKTSSDDVCHSSTQQSGVASSKLFPGRKSAPTTSVFSASPSKDDVVVRCPENVTSVRELFEYKMGKRRMESVNSTTVTAKSTWRPW